MSASGLDLTLRVRFLLIFIFYFYCNLFFFFVLNFTPYEFLIFFLANAPWGSFMGNVAHSVKLGMTTCSSIGGGYNGSLTTGTIQGLSIYGADMGIFFFCYIANHCYIVKLTFYYLWTHQSSNVMSGIWPCGAPQKYQNLVIAETLVGINAVSKHIYQNLALVCFRLFIFSGE